MRITEAKIRKIIRSIVRENYYGITYPPGYFDPPDDGPEFDCSCGGQGEVNSRGTVMYACPACSGEGCDDCDFGEVECEDHPTCRCGYPLGFGDHSRCHLIDR